MSKTMEDLRESLFSTLQAIKDGSMDLDKARAVNEVAKTIVDTAKVEVDYLKTTGGRRVVVHRFSGGRQQPARWHHWHHGPQAALMAKSKPQIQSTKEDL